MMMTKNQAIIRGAVLEAREQSVVVEITKLREKIASLETKRESILMERANNYIAYNRARK